MTFTVYAPDGPLIDALLIQFNKIAKTSHAKTKEELLAHNAANIIVVSPFHDLPFPSSGKKVLHIVVFAKTPPTLSTAPQGSYFVEEHGNPVDIAKIIVKRFLGFESHKSCVISPHEFLPDTTLPVFLVPVHEVIAEKVIAPVLPHPVVTAPSPVPPVGESRPHSVLQPPVHLSTKRSLRKIPRRRLTQGTLVFFVLLVWVISLPFVLLLVSGGCAMGALKTFPIRNSILTRPLLQCSNKAASVATTLTQLVPIKSPHNLASFMYDASFIALEAQSVFKAVPTVTIQSLHEVSPLLFNIAREVSILSSRTQDISQIAVLSERIAPLFSHARLLQLVASGAAQSENILGQGSPKTYLVLLQNNMELRPTGGFIGSFILVDVDNGEVTAQKIYDVYDADGQMSGYVKPPEAIVKYLGEASWHLRDSNWDPDFATSAKRAEWFLDKSLNRQIDGVIGVNLEVLRTLIKSLGPLEVPDYGGSLTADNFYATIQSEVHKEFFPGSRKKSNYLTAVFNVVLTKLNTQGKDHALSLLTGILENIDSRDIQIYMNNESLQNEIIKAGIGGDLSVNSLGFVEANVGVNKANQYIERQGAWSFEKGESQIKAKGVFELTNTAIEQGDETRYRVYLRTFAPKGSELTAYKISIGGKDQAIVPEKNNLDTRSEEGAFFEIKGGERAVISIAWNCPTSPDFFLRKQGGVPAYPVSLSVLTDGTSRQYNTTFAQDERIPL